jgi:hypothetical protein
MGVCKVKCLLPWDNNSAEIAFVGGLWKAHSTQSSHAFPVGPVVFDERNVVRSGGIGAGSTCETKLSELIDELCGSVVVSG